MPLLFIRPFVLSSRILAMVPLPLSECFCLVCSLSDNRVCSRIQICERRQSLVRCSLQHVKYGYQATLLC